MSKTSETPLAIQAAPIAAPCSARVPTWPVSVTVVPHLRVVVHVSHPGDAPRRVGCL